MATAARIEEPLDENLGRRARLDRPRWEPKKWHPVYEEVVLLDCLGYKNTEIAKLKGFTTVHISNILNSIQGKMVREILLARLRAKGEETFDQRIERYANKALDRVEEVLNNDEYAAKNPGGIFDRAITMLRVSGKVKDPDKDQPMKGALMIPIEAMDTLKKAIALSDEARRINMLAPAKESLDTTFVPTGEVVEAKNG